MDYLTRSFLTKLANQQFQGSLLPPGQDVLSNPQQLGSVLGQHLQQYPGYAPGTPQFGQYVAQQKFTPEYAQGLYNMQQRMLGMAQDPAAVRTMGAGQMPDLQPLMQGVGAQQFLPNTWGQSAKNVGMGLLAQGANLAGYGPQVNAMMAARQAQAQSGVQQGLMGSLDRNSPFARRMLAQMGTTYLGNKIDDWTSGLGTFGRGLRGAGHFLTGLLSRIPGYETMMNKGIDWFGPDLSKVFPQQQKQSSVSPYSHYTSIRTRCGTEVLSPWILR